MHQYIIHVSDYESGHTLEIESPKEYTKEEFQKIIEDAWRIAILKSIRLCPNDDKFHYISKDLIGDEEWEFFWDYLASKQLYIVLREYKQKAIINLTSLDKNTRNPLERFFLRLEKLNNYFLRKRHENKSS